MNYVLRDYQVQASDAAVRFFKNTKSDRNGLLVLPTGCHAKGTHVLMGSGDLIKVEDVKIGDVLMGDDGTERTVISLHRGMDEMYRISPIKGESFVVNGGHILHLYKTNEGKNYPSCKPRYDEISVREYVGKSANYKHLHKLHRSRIVNFSKETQLPLSPYFVGLYLGDGCSTNGVNITTQRAEVASYLYDFANSHGVYLRAALKNNGINKAKSYFFPLKKSHKNPITSKIRELGLGRKTAGEKFIPQIYKTASIENRFLLLAGLLDTDAYYDKSRNTFEYCSKSKRLAEDVVFLCRSLGLYAMIGETKQIKGTDYYRIQISGDLNLIPTKVGIRKGHKRLQKKSPLVTGFTVEYVGLGEYYGFSLDGNHLYLDSQFFVHHNSGKSLIVADIAQRLHQNVLILQPSKEILEQNYAKYKSYGMENCSIYSASFNSKEISEVTFATIGSIMAHIDDFDHFKAIIIDEAHGVNPVEGQYATFIRKVKRKVLGLTATPYRLTTAQGIETTDKGFMPNGSFRSSDYFIDDFMPKPGVTLRNACILKFLTRTRPRIFHDVLYEVSIQTLLQNGYLAKLRYFDMTAIDTSRVKRNSTGRDYDEKSLSKEFSRCGLSNQLVDVVKRLLHPKNNVPRKGILVFTQFITESEQLTREIDGVAVVTGSTKKKDRERILEDFKSGKIKVLSNVGILTTGFDYPELDTVVMARPTMSLALWYQIVGRIIRPSKGKDGWVIDLGENIKRFGKVDDLALREDKPEQYYISGVVEGKVKQLTNIYY